MGRAIAKRIKKGGGGGVVSHLLTRFQMLAGGDPPPPTIATALHVGMSTTPVGYEQY